MQESLFGFAECYKVTESEDGIIHIADEENGVGFIAITKYTIPINYEFVIEDEANDFLSSIEGYTEDIKPVITKHYSTKVSTEFLSSDNRFWKVWVFYEYKTAIFITYNCHANDKTIELSTVEKMINSIVINEG